MQSIEFSRFGTLENGSENYSRASPVKDAPNISQATNPGGSVVIFIEKIPRLTPRQWEVLGRLVAGKRHKEIREELWISEATLDSHLRGIYKVFDSHCCDEAVAKAQKWGYIAHVT